MHWEIPAVTGVVCGWGTKSIGATAKMAGTTRIAVVLTHASTARARMAGSACILRT